MYFDIYFSFYIQQLCVCRENKYTKRGISIVPTKMGVSYGCSPVEQGAALIMAYTDGSVLLTHGGVEVGQGLHTRMIQV